MREQTAMATHSLAGASVLLWCTKGDAWARVLGTHRSSADSQARAPRPDEGADVLTADHGNRGAPDEEGRAAPTGGQ